MRKFLFFCAFFSLTAFAADYQKASEDISVKLHQSLEVYQSGKADEASSMVSDSYFDLFEASGLEAYIGGQSASLKSDLESQFNALRSAYKSQTPVPKIATQIDHLTNQIKAVVMQGATEQTFWQSLFNSFVILFREGFEAILVISALVAFIVKTKNLALLKTVASAVWTALGASVLTAIIFQTILKISPAAQELMEGITLLIACGVLFTVGHWMINQSESAQWQSYIRNNLQSSVATHSIRFLWFTCFLAVYREGAETVLFYQALLASSPNQHYPIYMGLLIAAVALALVYALFKRGVLKIPLKPFFRFTSSLLYYLAFVFAGRAVIELQAGGYLRVHSLAGWPTISVLGIYPTAQSLALQSLFIIAILFSLIKVFLKKESVPL